VDNAEYLGTFIARSDALKAVFPEENVCGLWQAWRMPDGDYIVQPLNMDKQPCGNLSMMQAEDFVYSLSPLPSDEEIAAVGKRFLRADAPDLLDVWYEQGREEDQARQAASGAASSAVFHPAAQAAQPGAEAPQAVSARPAVISGGTPPNTAAAGSSAGKGAALYEAPVFVEIEKTDPPGQDSFEDVLQAVSDTFARKQKEFSGNGGLPSLFVEPEQANAGEAAAVQETPLAEAAEDHLYEERAAILENSMREEFAMLMGQLDESPYPAVEKDVEKLLLRGNGFTWKQKFMFSEFGMALRRKGKARLSLMAHERALGLAPGDGHILFNLARSEYELGDIRAAKTYLQQALSVLPDFAPARSFLAFLEGHQGEVKA
jgi:tetratricopeptide (TPR) repeat protein